MNIEADTLSSSSRASMPGDGGLLAYAHDACPPQTMSADPTHITPPHAGTDVRDGGLPAEHSVGSARARSLALDRLLQGQAQLWRGREAPGFRTHPSGYASLDALLPGGGWPVGALTELIVPQPGLGELRLLIPLMARMPRPIAWVSPPYIPYAQALSAAGVDLAQLLVVRPSARDYAWTLEQLLRSCGLVLAWPTRMGFKALRRLQLATAVGQSVGMLYLDHDLGATPAALRLRLQAGPQGLTVQVLKARGPAGCVHLPLS